MWREHLWVGFQELWGSGVQEWIRGKCLRGDRVRKGVGV